MLTKVTLKKVLDCFHENWLEKTYLATIDSRMGIFAHIHRNE